MIERTTRENAWKNLQISLSRTKIVEMIHACAVRETLLALRCAISFKAKKEPPKMFSKKKKITERAIHTESKQSQTKSKKYLTIYSINIGLYYSTKKYYCYISTIQTNSQS